ncbi:MAG TPA: hypothetical protein VMB20_08755 [Candidatus Acidoferrum sp.]|nr:hypothetical protein [Candidatus Acidoferrum sp.]
MRLADIRSRATQLYMLTLWLYVPAVALIAFTYAALTAHHFLLGLTLPTVVFAICVVAECWALLRITTTTKALFARVDDVIERTTQASAEAIAMELDEKAALHAELNRLRRSA